MSELLPASSISVSENEAVDSGGASTSLISSRGGRSVDE